MEEEKVIEISMKKDGSTILVEFEPKNALKVEEEDRTLYLVKGNNAGEKEECYYLFDERKNSKIKNINIDKYSEEEMQSLLDFFKNKKAVNVEIDDLPEYVIRTYDVECPVKDVLNGNYAGFTRTPAGSPKSISIKILEVNDKNEPTKIEVTMDGITNTITDIEYCKRAIKKYAAQEKKEYDDVLKELIENMNHEDEKKDNKKKKICVTALAIGSGIALLITGAIIDRAIQKGHVVTNNKNKVVTEFQVSDKSTGSESIKVKDDTIIVEEKVEEIKSDEVHVATITSTKSGDYQSNMFEIADWVNGKKDKLKEHPYYHINELGASVDSNVLYYFNQMRSQIVANAYTNNNKKQTKYYIELFRENFMSFIYDGFDLFDNTEISYTNMSIDAKRELMDIGLAVFSMNINQNYYVDGETFDNDSAYEKICQTYDALYSKEYGTRSK